MQIITAAKGKWRILRGLLYALLIAWLPAFNTIWQMSSGDPFFQYLAKRGVPSWLASSEVVTGTEQSIAVVLLIVLWRNVRQNKNSPAVLTVSPQPNETDGIGNLLRDVEIAVETVNLHAYREERLYEYVFASRGRKMPKAEPIPLVEQNIVQRCYSWGVEMKWYALSNIGSKLDALNKAVTKWNDAPNNDLRSIHEITRQAVPPLLLLARNEAPLYINADPLKALTVT